MIDNNEEYSDVLAGLNERFNCNRKSVDDFSERELNRLYMELKIYDYQERLGAKVFMCSIPRQP